MVPTVRVLTVVNNFPWPGNIDGIFNLRHVQALKARGHSVRVLRYVPRAPSLGRRWSTYRSIPAEYEIDGVPVRSLRVFLGPRWLGLQSIPLQSRAALASEVARFAPDIVHVHGLLPAGAIALTSPIPFVLTGHGTETYHRPWTRRDLESLARRVVAQAAACAGVSEFVASNLRRLGANETRVIFNGADPAVFHPGDRRSARTALALPPNAPLIVFAGHVVESKGVGELQRAAIALADLGAHVAVAGEGPLKAPLHDALTRNGVGVTLFPVLKHAQLAQLMTAADVVTLPSHAEGLPTTIAEAMCAGRAVVATDAGGIPEIVRDGRTGFVVPIRAPEALEARLRDVLTNAALRERFERAAYGFAGEHLTWRSNVLAYESLYREVLAGSAGGERRWQPRTPQDRRGAEAPSRQGERARYG
jgi:teichuronic acid biosynthesis glycosyltransferase TuaC